MASQIHCDYTGCPDLADVMVSRLANGETFAWCDSHYLVMCVAIAEAAAEAEAAATAAEAVDRLGASPAVASIDAATAAALPVTAADVDALEGAFPTLAVSSAAGDPPAVSPGNAPSDVGETEAGPMATPRRNGRPGASVAATDDTAAPTTPA